MFYVGAILIANGRYTFAKMLEVFTLIIFSITFSAQIMTYRELCGIDFFDVENVASRG